MSDDDDIWNQRGTLTRVHDEGADVALPPLPADDAQLRPLRDLLLEFAAAPAWERERYSLILDNGQAFSADDITALLQRPDSPVQ